MRCRLQNAMYVAVGRLQGMTSETWRIPEVSYSKPCICALPFRYALK